jgi:hypothetical protein
MAMAWICYRSPNGGVTATAPITVGACTYALNPSNQVVPSTGGTVTIQVTTQPGCAWTASGGAAWLPFAIASGSGSGAITLTAPVNTSAGTQAATVNLAGLQAIVTQPATACTYGLSQTQINAPAAGASGTITVTRVCPVVASSNASWANVTPLGSSVSYTVGTNNGTSSRNATLTVGTQTVPVVQTGSEIPGVSGLSPAVAALSGPAFTLTVTGTNFVSGATVQWNGAALVTTFVSATQLMAAVPAALIGSAGTANVTVVNPGGAMSAEAPFTIDATAAQFADVPPSATFFDAANLMFEAGVTTGCVAGSTPETRSFCPNDSVTREQMAAFIVRAVTGTTTPTIYNTTSYFTDVPTTNLFFPHIQKLKDLGITTGCAPGLFCPTDTIPRWEMAIFMIRARLALYGATFTTATTPYFADVPTNVEGNGVPFPFIQRSYEEHITAGCGTDPLIYCPNELVTRGQMASFIMRGLFNETTIVGVGAPQVAGVNPNTMASTVGTQITVTITGVNTAFQMVDTVTVPSGMLTVSDVVVNSATSISATLTANPNVVAGPQALIVTSGGQNLVLPLAIKVGTY